MFRRQTKKEKNLWTEYPNYSPIFNVNEKPLFDEAKVNEEHKILGQIIRENWDLIHPLTKDYILSSAIEWRKLLSEINLMQSNLETKESNLTNYDSAYQKKTQKLLFEKEAEIEKRKEEIAESFKEIIENKDREIAHYKMLVESAESSLEELKTIKSTLETEKLTKNQKTEELEKMIQDLMSKYKSQETEATNVQTSISQNFQKQLDSITKELYEKQDQIEKLKNILTKAKEQLVALKEKNNELKIKNSHQESRIETLERMLVEKNEKLLKLAKSLENLE